MFRSFQEAKITALLVSFAGCFACATPKTKDHSLPLDETGVSTPAANEASADRADVKGPSYLFFSTRIKGSPGSVASSDNSAATSADGLPDEIPRENLLVCRRFCEKEVGGAQSMDEVCQVKSTKAVSANELLAIAGSDWEKRALGFLLADLSYRPSVVAGNQSKGSAKLLFNKLNQKFDSSNASTDNCRVAINVNDTDVLDEEDFFYNDEVTGPSPAPTTDGN